MDPARNTGYNDRRQRYASARRRKAIRRRNCLYGVCFALLIILLGLLGFLLDNRYVAPDLNKVVTINAGETPTPEMFLMDAEQYGNVSFFKTDISALDLRIAGTHSIQIKIGEAVYSATLVVEDKIPPTGEAVPAVTELNILPEPAKLVTNLQDVSDVTVSYATPPDVSKGGETIASVLLTDGSGNTTVIEVPVTVISDEVPPVIEGAVDLEFFVGDPIAYKAGITVTDDQTAKPKLTVDNSQVDTKKAGTYPVTYTATDDAGNTASVTVQLTLVDKPASYVEPEEVNKLAREVLEEITTEDMTPMQVAFAIYRWTSTHISYTGDSDKSSWTGAAYQAFTKRSGDCYNYFAAAKALYEVAGIENVDVVKSDTSHSSHYWSLINLGDGWYHVDCTPRRNPGKFFMNTDAELEAYSVKNKNSHIFESDLYPQRATKSVQDLVDYGSGKVRG